MVNFQHLNLCTHHSPDSEGEFETLVSSVGDLQPPSFLPNRDTFYDPEEPDEVSFVFSDHSPGGRVPVDGTEFEIGFDGEENQMHVHLNTTATNLDRTFDYVLEEIPVPEFEVSSLASFFHIDAEFSSVAPSATVPPNSEVTAVRVNSDETDINFIRDEEGTRVRFDLAANPIIERDSIVDDVEQYIEDAREHLEETHL